MAMQSPDPKDASHDLLAQRDPAALTQWFEAYADVVYAFAFHRLSRDPDLAADVVQEVFLQALDGIGNFDPARGAMLTWLVLIARNCIADVRRQRQRYETGADAWERIDNRLLEACRQIRTHPLPEDVVTSEETAQMVRVAMASIPADYCEVLEGRYYREETLSQIALRRSSTEGAVKSLLHRARLALKDAFLAVTQTLHDASQRGG